MPALMRQVRHSAMGSTGRGGIASTASLPALQPQAACEEGVPQVGRLGPARRLGDAAAIGRDLQASQANRADDGSPSAGREICGRHGGHERWGRLVKRLRLRRRVRRWRRAWAASGRQPVAVAADVGPRTFSIGAFLFATNPWAGNLIWSARFARGRRHEGMGDVGDSL